MLSPAAEQKINRILAIRDEIATLVAELEVLLDLRNAEPGTTALKMSGESKRRFAMPKNRISAEGSIEPVKRGEKKSCCGSKGVRHFGWCKTKGGDGVNPTPKTEKLREPMSIMEYDRLKVDANDRNFQSAWYAKDKSLSLYEVNAALVSTTYDDYLIRRDA